MPPVDLPCAPTHPRTADRHRRLRRRPPGWFTLLLPLIASHAAVFGAASPATPVPSPFARDLAPVLVERCLKCHGADQPKGRYRLDTPAHLLEPGESGKPPITPRDPAASHLFELLVTPDDDDRMPQKSARLDDATIVLFRRWIEAGAPFEGLDTARPLVDLAGATVFPPPPESYRRPVPITAIEFLAPDLLAVAGFREITLWSTHGTLCRRLRSVPERIHALRLHPDRARLFFAGGAPGRNGAAGVIDLADGAATPRIFGRSPDVLLALALSSDGERVALGGTERDIVVFDTRTLERQRTLAGHSDWILDLAFSPDGKRLASASRDRTARVFDTTSGALVSAFREHNDAVTAITFLEDGATLATAGRDGRIRTWEAGTAKALKSSKPVSAEPTRLVCRNGRLTSTWADGRVREYPIGDLDSPREFAAPGERLVGLAQGPATNQLAAGGHDGMIQVWATSTNGPPVVFPATPGFQSKPTLK